MKNSLRTTGRIAAAFALAVGGITVGGTVSAEEVQRDTNLAGFSVQVQASPILILLDDPKLAIPRPTGTSVVEGDPNFTLASVAAGPNAHAIASTLWPGNLLGEGLSAFNPNIPPYPLKAESRYPDKPYTAQGVDGGVLTSSSALGLDAFAQADALPTNKPGPLTVGGVTSTSTATVTPKDVATGTAVSAVHDVNLLGLIHIGAVTTHLVSTADGKKPTSGGTTTVTGLTIAGQSVTVDDKGVHLGAQGSALPELTTPQQLEDALGISIKGIVTSSKKSPDGASTTASGLVIRIDTKLYKAALKPVIDPLRPTYADLLNQLKIPQDQQGNFFYLLNATPNVTFVFGSGTTGSSASLPISFEPPTIPSFPTGPGLGGGGGSSVVPPGMLGGVPSTGDPGTSVPPVLSPPGSSGPALASAAATSSGIGATWVLGALIGSGLVGWALTRFLGLAGGVLGFGCRLGAPTSIPDLRSVTA